MKDVNENADLPMRRPFLRCAKWSGLLLLLVIAFAFLVSTRRAVMWTSATSRYQAAAMLGRVSWAWRPTTWRPEEERYPARAGWDVAEYGGGGGCEWWIEQSSNRSWAGIGIPLWMPFLVVAVSTAVLWYRDRRNIPIVYRRWQVRLCPERRRRVTVKLVVVMCLAHAVTVILGVNLTASTCRFLLSGAVQTLKLVDHALLWLVALLLLPTPFWGLLWARVYVRSLNALFVRVRPHHCLECGYDLTGNVSGVCSECGTPFRDSAQARMTEPGNA
jgi:hypothetical protein